MYSASLLRAFGIGALVLAQVAAAQGPPGPTPCDRALSEAEHRYREQMYVAVAPVVLECIYHPASTPAEVEQGYRILALSYVKQGLLMDARRAVSQLLSVRPEYEPNPLSDIPQYVSLVGAVRERLGPPAEPDAPAPLQTPALVDPAPAAAPASELVDINTASADGLDRVPGIGPAIAQRIIAYRLANGPFRSVSELIDVSGIGPVSLERMAPFLAARADAVVPPAAAEVDLPAASRSLVNLNTASADELVAVDGIGPVLAARIVAFRERYGPFRDVEEVTLVSGIGPGKLDRMADQVTVE